MNKKILVVLLSVLLLVSLSTSVLAETVEADDAYPYEDIKKLNDYYRLGREFDGFHSFCFPGFPGGIFLTPDYETTAESVYHNSYPWLNSFNVSINDVDVVRSWDYGILYFREGGSIGTFEVDDNSICFFYNLRMTTSPEYQVRFFIQGFPSWVWANIEIYTASYAATGTLEDAWNNRYYSQTPFTYRRLSEITVSSYTMCFDDGETFTFPSSAQNSDAADNIYEIVFDMNGALDVYGFVIKIRNVMDITYSEFGEVDGGFFDVIGNAIGSVPSVLGTMFKYMFTTLPFLGTLAVISGCYIFVCAIKKWGD